MIFGKKILIWDLDDTLYPRTHEWAELLDTAMAEALVYDLKVPMNINEAKEKVTESYTIFRNGGEIFYRDYGVNQADLFYAYHKRKPVEMIIPYENLLEKIEKIPAEQYIFTASDRYASERILKQIGLYDFFKNRFYSVEDFGVFKKNENKEVYLEFCEKIGANPKDCVFVDDSYSNLEFAKEVGMTTVRIYYKNNSARDKTYIDYAYKGVESFIDEIINEAGEIAAQ